MFTSRLSETNLLVLVKMEMNSETSGSKNSDCQAIVPAATLKRKVRQEHPDMIKKRLRTDGNGY